MAFPELGDDDEEGTVGAPDAEAPVGQPASGGFGDPYGDDPFGRASDFGDDAFGDEIPVEVDTTEF